MTKNRIYFPANSNDIFQVELALTGHLMFMGGPNDYQKL